jgi:hypothetical protein
MDWKLFSQLVVTFMVAALGWWAGHFLSSRRDLANERRKLRVTYLLEAYRKLESAAHPSDQNRNGQRLSLRLQTFSCLARRFKYRWLPVFLMTSRAAAMARSTLC